jgi:tRNA pseudouridine38-40 synthase
MPTFKLTLAYDGTGFVGWQRQAKGTSIQALVEDALAYLAGGHTPVLAAGRTDAGVHALGQVASVSIERDVDAPTVVSACNARLPPAVRVTAAEQAAPAFHARYHARSKTYSYRLWNSDVLDPFERSYVWHVPGRLDVDAMARAAATIEGRHDFAAFQATGSTTETTVRELFSSRLFKGSDPAATGTSWSRPFLPRFLCSTALIEYEVSGNGFLRHMVRNIVGSLVEIGRGRHDAAWLAEVLAGRLRSEAGPTAPAAGLFLVRVDYAEAPVAVQP